MGGIWHVESHAGAREDDGASKIDLQEVASVGHDRAVLGLGQRARPRDVQGRPRVAGVITGLKSPVVSTPIRVRLASYYRDIVRPLDVKPWIEHPVRHGGVGARHR